MPKYLWLPRLVYMQGVETVKQLGPWSSLSIKVCAQHGDWNSRDHGMSIYSGGETRHNEILLFKLNNTLEVKVNHSKTAGILTKAFTPLVQIWWSQLKRVMGYCKDNSLLTQTHIDTGTCTDAGNNNTRRPKLAPQLKAPTVCMIHRMLAVNICGILKMVTWPLFISYWAII